MVPARSMPVQPDLKLLPFKPARTHTIDQFTNPFGKLWSFTRNKIEALLVVPSSQKDENKSVCRLFESSSSPASSKHYCDIRSDFLPNQLQGFEPEWLRVYRSPPFGRLRILPSRATV